MGHILISPQSIEEQQLLLKLFERLGIAVRIFSDDEEDVAMAKLMLEADMEDKVDRDEIMQKLKRA